LPQKTFERENGCYKGMEWEIEDLLPQDFVEAFLSDYHGAVIHSTQMSDKVHQELTRDGKAQFPGSFGCMQSEMM
jgi:hypothetical protein